MIQEMIRKALKPIMAEVAEEAYKQGAEDVIRRFAFVYDAVGEMAKRDVYADIGAIDTEELSPEVFDEITEPITGTERVKRSEVLA